MDGVWFEFAKFAFDFLNGENVVKRIDFAFQMLEFCKRNFYFLALLGEPSVGSGEDFHFMSLGFEPDHKTAQEVLNPALFALRDDNGDAHSLTIAEIAVFG